MSYVILPKMSSRSCNFLPTATGNCDFVLLCRKGEVACCEEIKAFAVKHNIKQQQIAVLAGM